MSAMGNGQCKAELLYDGQTFYCIIPKGHQDKGIPHRTEWVDGHQHNWFDDDGADTTIKAKEGQPITDIGGF